jgi:hypothetical protein
MTGRDVIAGPIRSPKQAEDAIIEAFTLANLKRRK